VFFSQHFYPYTRDIKPMKLPSFFTFFSSCASVCVLTTCFSGIAEAADKPNQQLVSRGYYLSQLGNCEHCHTPGHFLGKRDQSKTLSGSDVGFWDPNLGTVIGPNITPDDETGIGTWTPQDIRLALTTGERPDGRLLSPVMPWADLAQLQEPDILALVEYLKSLKPVKNRVPGPFGPAEAVPVHTLRLAPPDKVKQR
jgi:mono/diheme cytochrome c family protein